jgi:hypothetical protein
MERDDGDDVAGVRACRDCCFVMCDDGVVVEKAFVLDMRAAQAAMQRVEVFMVGC